MKLLIVEDSINIRQNLRKLISSIKDIEIIGEAEDEKKAVRLALKKNPDIIILDIDLKEGSGFNVIKKAKKENSKVKVIIFSNFVSYAYREKAFKEKADYFFDKNSELDKLIELLEKLVHERS
jgi:DNA-binding NarL/FixJ family response regulator